jgi:hypothetical protein
MMMIGGRGGIFICVCARYVFSTRTQNDKGGTPLNDCLLAWLCLVQTLCAPFPFFKHPFPSPFPFTSARATGDEAYGDRVVVRNVKTDEAELIDEIKAAFGPGIVKIKYERRLLRLKYETPEGAEAAVAKSGAQPFGTPLIVEFELRPSARKARAIASGAPDRKVANRAAAAAAAAASSSSSAPAAATAGLVVLVRQVAVGTTVESLKSFFAFAGPIAALTLNVSGTAATITFLTPEAANKALIKEGAELAGAKLNVEIKRRVAGAPRTPKAAGGAVGGGDGAVAAGRKRTTADDEVDTSASVWVGSIPEASDEASVSAIFAHVGAIKKIAVRGRNDKKFANSELCQCAK